MRVLARGGRAPDAAGPREHEQRCSEPPSWYIWDRKFFTLAASQQRRLERGARCFEGGDRRGTNVFARPELQDLELATSPQRRDVCARRRQASARGEHNAVHAPVSRTQPLALSCTSCGQSEATVSRAAFVRRTQLEMLRLSMCGNLARSACRRSSVRLQRRECRRESERASARVSGRAGGSGRALEARPHLARMGTRSSVLVSGQQTSRLRQ
jgi:hypothetical protein